MTPEGEPLDSQIAALRLSGKRFDQAGIPATALVEVVAFEDLIREIAKHLWRQRNPRRKRVPKGYDDYIGLRLVDINEGSAISVLERPSVDADGLFGEQEVLDDLETARMTLEEFITASRFGKDIPELIHAVPKSKIKKFGQSLRSDEALQVGAHDNGSWHTRSLYTPQDRHRVLIRLTGGYTDEATVDGFVENINIPLRTCNIRMDTGLVVAAPWADTGVKFEVEDSDAANPRCHVEGIGEFNREGVLTKFTSVDSFTILDEGDDSDEDEDADNAFTSARTTLREMTNLEEGWLDGENGEVPSPDTLRFADHILSLLRESRVVTKFIYPTEEGGVQFEWPESVQNVSLEIEPTLKSVYAHAADLGAGTYDDARFEFVASDENEQFDYAASMDELIGWLKGRVLNNG